MPDMVLTYTSSDECMPCLALFVDDMSSIKKFTNFILVITYATSACNPSYIKLFHMFYLIKKYLSRLDINCKNQCLKEIKKIIKIKKDKKNV